MKVLPHLVKTSGKTNGKEVKSTLLTSSGVDLLLQ